MNIWNVTSVGSPLSQPILIKNYVLLNANKKPDDLQKTNTKKLIRESSQIFAGSLVKDENRTNMVIDKSPQRRQGQLSELNAICKDMHMLESRKGFEIDYSEKVREAEKLIEKQVENMVKPKKEKCAAKTGKPKDTSESESNLLNSKIGMRFFYYINIDALSAVLMPNSKWTMSLLLPKEDSIYLAISNHYASTVIEKKEPRYYAS